MTDQPENHSPPETDVPRLTLATPGDAAGIEPQQLAGMPTTEGSARVTVYDYCPDQFQKTEVKDIEEFIIHHRPEKTVVRWINVDGLKDMNVIRALAEKYELHPLAIEDMLNPNQRPKVEPYEGAPGQRARVFIVARMVQLINGKLESEQVSFFVGHNTVLTFQETPGDVWDSIRDRISKTGSRIRMNDASFLVYALLDAVVDQYFPILENYGDVVEDLENRILDNPRPENIQEAYQLRRQLLLLRRAVWPMREVFIALQREEHECMSPTTRTYLRDVYDHCVQIIDIIETYREMSSVLTETYMNTMSFRMNQVMKVLTIIGTIFIPLTFLAGVYGMNFKYLPELEWHYAYPAFWVICIVVAGGLLAAFKRNNWL